MTVPAPNSFDPNDSARLARQWAKAQGSVAAFINSLVHDFAEAEELLQETAAQVFGHVHQFDPSRPFLPWTLGIARNVVLKHRRSAARDRHVFDHDTVAKLAEAFAELSDRREGLRRSLTVCREKLPPRSKEVCRLRYEDGFSAAQIAGRIGSTAGAVATMLNRVREQLRRCVEREFRSEVGIP